MRPLTRADKLAALEQEWDLVVVGGGISGAGVLREAARRGWKALLIEQRDFAWGTSSRSSKLVHGGLRYLKEGRFGLTLHSVRERQRLMAEAPELIETQSFLFGDFAGRKPGRWLFQLGLEIYDRMAGQRSHRYVDAHAASTFAPGLAQRDLRGAMLYLDAKTDDARLVLRVLQEAQADGGIALNYMAARQLRLDGGRVSGIEVEDSETGLRHTLRARTVVNATGAWADRLRGQLGRAPTLRPLRGSHLTFPAWRVPVAQSISAMHPHDGRPVFIYPWEGVTLVGTTDLDHGGELDCEAAISADEVAYLLAAVNDQLPGLAVGYDDIVASYAGVRPVVDDGTGDPSSAGRDHVVMDEDGLITVTGGKLTTFRLMALDALRLAAGRLNRPLGNSDGPMFSPAIEPRGLNPAATARLLNRYGPLAAIAARQAGHGELDWIAGSASLWLELRWAALHESVVHLDDLLLRRTRLGIVLPQGGLGQIERIRTLVQPALGWDEGRWLNEVARYRSLIDAHYSLPPRETVPGWQRYLAPKA
ncbi:glycerol-3-phosphate dehydrogenase/oxidase [Chitinimonas lacunae]|uniref:Glycerol-3-phosphate dehydrogenase/oxidase n=1 Tax=Chitinimonas lacunae TaxID=1963018 RepID=A0ABV8MTB2_9NEIS